MDERFRKEIKRKAFHFLSLLYAALYFIAGRAISLKVLGTLLAVEAFIEFGRFRVPGMNEALLRFFGGIHRVEESDKATGIFWTLLGCVATMAAFNRRGVVLCALGQLAFGDGLAGLVGVRFGRHPIRPGKSWEGSLACFLASFAVACLFFDPGRAAASALFVSVIELLPLPYNDNLWIPLLSGAFLTLSFRLFPAGQGF